MPWIITLILHYKVQLELQQYLSKIRNSSNLPVTDAMSFWKKYESQYPLLSKVALDILSLPTSQAYVERAFSVTGILCSGRRNRMSKNLEKRAFLQLNRQLS